MGFNYSPKVVTKGLSIYLDAGNTKSYPKAGTGWYSLYPDNFLCSILTPSGFFTTEYGGGITSTGNNQVTFNDTNINADFTYSFVVKKTSHTNAFLVANAFTNGMSIVLGETGLYVQKSFSTNVPTTIVDFGASSATLLNTVYFITVSLIKSTNTFYCYINGSLINTGVYNTTFNAAQQKLLRYTSNAALVGTLYLFQGYTKKLSDSEVLQNYNTLKGRFGL